MCLVAKCLCATRLVPFSNESEMKFVLHTRCPVVLVLFVAVNGVCQGSSNYPNGGIKALMNVIEAM